MKCPLLLEHCRGRECGNFNDTASKFGDASKPHGCKGDNPTFQWARKYIGRDAEYTGTRWGDKQDDAKD